MAWLWPDDLSNRYDKESSTDGTIKKGKGIKDERHLDEKEKKAATIAGCHKG